MEGTSKSTIEGAIPSDGKTDQIKSSSEVEVNPKTVLKAASQYGVSTTAHQPGRESRTAKDDIKGFVGLKSNDKVQAAPLKEPVAVKQRDMKPSGPKPFIKKMDGFEKYLLFLNVILSTGIFMTILGIMATALSEHYGVNIFEAATEYFLKQGFDKNSVVIFLKQISSAGMESFKRILI